jgi:hypothetical protein
VTVRQHRDGRLSVAHGQLKLTCRELDARPVAPRIKPVVVNHRKYKPAADHPWRGRSLSRVVLGGDSAPVSASASTYAESPPKTKDKQQGHFYLSQKGDISNPVRHSDCLVPRVWSSDCQQTRLGCGAVCSAMGRAVSAQQQRPPAGRSGQA